MPSEHPIDEGVRVDASPGECRRCRSFCDRMIEPRDCVAMGCRYVYSHHDKLTGLEYVGCMRRVFSGEVTADSLRQRGGFGGIKVTGELLSHCQFRIERAYEGDGEAYSCVNRRFFDWPDSGPDAIRAFDLRDALETDGR